VGGSRVTGERPKDPILAVIANDGNAVLAIVIGVDGPSYRPLGAMMAVFGSGDCVGTLSSGCIECDIALHAAKLGQSDMPVLLRYGRGSPFMDIQLPCGGGLDVLLVPVRDASPLVAIARNRTLRIPSTLIIDITDGGMAVAPTGTTSRTQTHLSIRFEPDVRFHIFGKGPEAVTFAALVHSAGYPSLLLSPDAETLAEGQTSGGLVRQLAARTVPKDLACDHRTAVVLFFHDHDWEPPLLADALATPAFYIGAQGSQRARDSRLAELRAMGVAEQSLARLHGPIGLIPSARDAGTLAVSVLAQVLAIAMDK
jgi:xanthine dehydrogenase accessory factor